MIEASRPGRTTRGPGHCGDPSSCLRGLARSYHNPFMLSLLCKQLKSFDASASDMSACSGLPGTDQHTTILFP